MKILAVIPARAGSKGIPNKNIRIVGGHPLIYFAINNALKSKYITDIVVTTDSNEVRIISSQMGVGCRWRRRELCTDDITLDSVIFDAIPEGVEWDYVVTLQPTSPTLRSETLDQAIKYTIENKLDTLISAVNHSCLSWKDEDGRKVPSYKERLNRQYLPSQYIETGAFLISKKKVVTENNRIGEVIDIFELPEDESHDIDTFEDLLCADVILRRDRVAIYVNGNKQRGMGHIYRALEIADEFYVKPDIFYDINQTDPELFGNTTHNLIPVNGISELYQICKKKNYTLFINDILNTSIDYMIGLRTALPNTHIINFEDEGEGNMKADIVINALMSNSDLPNVYVGEHYYMANKLFLLYNPIIVRKEVTRVFICFGGADPMNYTDKVLEMVTKDEYKKYQFVFALGRAKGNVEELLEYNKYENIEVVYDVSDMPGMMSECDIAISSRGRTAYELAFLGIPTIVVSENEREKNHSFACNENGFTYIGMDPADEIFESNIRMYLGLSKENRQKLHDTLLSHNLRNGRKHVMGLINSL